MKLAIVGYGKMGRLIEQLSPKFDAQVTLTLDIHNNANFEGMTPANFKGIDAAIEFSTPETAPANLTRLAGLGVNTVCGTTGWFKELGAVSSAFHSAGAGLVYSPNFSIGVNVFQRLVEEAGKLMANESDYEAWAWEIHHSAKKDAPSGTLLKLVAGMQKAGYARNIDQSASRAGAHPGTHEIGFDSAADTVTLRHVARSREGFARGALRAAQWIAGKQGVYEFSEILFSASNESAADKRR
jgi:4-hydroxy-tetrahydrodipicolinate reductase